jgi:ribosomal protein L22
MSPAPKKPADPKEGKVADTTPEEAVEAKQAAATEEAAAAQPEAKPKRTRAKKAEPEAAGQAAAETGIDKTAAEATEEKPKPRRTRAKKDEPKPAEEKKKPARESGRGRKRDRRPQVEPGVLVRAQARYVRTSARKARLVCDHIRGKDVAEARAILAFTPRAAAKPWLKLLESAVANAEHNHELVGEELRISSVHADEGPTLKRFRPRAMGRATRIRKRTSHLSIELTPKEN